MTALATAVQCCAPLSIILVRAAKDVSSERPSAPLSTALPDTVDWTDSTKFGPATVLAAAKVSQIFSQTVAASNFWLLEARAAQQISSLSHGALIESAVVLLLN